MKDTTKKLLEKLSSDHDWLAGTVYNRSGLHYSSTDICRVCSLRRHWEEDKQNGIPDTYRFSDGETGQDLSLRQAIARGCMAITE